MVRRRAVMCLLGCLAMATIGFAQEATPLPNRPSRLGITGVTRVHSNGYGSVKIVGVQPGSPATRMLRPPDAVKRYHMVPNRDYVTKVNDQRVRSIEEMQDAISRSNRECTLEIYDSVTKKYDTYYVELR